MLSGAKRTLLRTDNHAFMENDVNRRLEVEAAHQDARVKLETEEPRDRFYYLVSQAFRDYQGAVNSQTGKRVVVTGCSEGGVTPLARAGNRVTGVDISPEALRRLDAAIEREGLSDRADTQLMNAEDLDFPEHSLDAIVCTGVLHHLDIPVTLRSWNRVLKPDGCVYMLEPMAYHPAIALYRRLTPALRTEDEHPLKVSDIRLLRESFEVVKVKSYAMTTVASLPFAYLPGMRWLRDGTKAALTVVDKILWGILPPLRYFAWTWYIECRNPKD